AHVGSAQKEFSGVRIARRGENFITEIRREPAQRRQRLRVAKIAGDDRVGGADAGAFGRTVNIFQVRAVSKKVVDLLKLWFGKTFAAENNLSERGKIARLQGARR